MNKQILIFNLTFSLFCFITASLSGQSKNIKIADEAFSRQQYQTALEYYKSGLKEQKQNTEEKGLITARIAEIYYLTNNWKNAVLYYERLDKSGYLDKHPEYCRNYASALQYQGYDSLALIRYDQYLNSEPADSLIFRKRNDLITLSKAENPSKYKIENISTINSSDDEFGLIFSNRNENQVVFTSNRKGSTGKAIDQWTSSLFSDLFQAELKPDGKFSKAESADKQTILNTKSHEGVSSFNKNYSSLYCTRCEQKPKKKSSNVYCYIIKSNRTGLRWSKTEVVYSNLTANSGHPSISEDELSMIFSGGDEKGFGNNDLWIATRDSKRKPFSEAVNLGNTINTKENEMFPYLRNDSVLYFASDGHGAYGGLDLFKSTRNSKGDWSKPENLGQGINSCGDDFSIVFKNESENGYFASNRPGGKGGDDIYSFEKIQFNLRINGQVSATTTNQALESAEVILINGNDSIAKRTNVSGEYVFDQKDIKSGVDYIVIARKSSYFSQKQSFSTNGIKNDKQWNIDFQLEPIPSSPIILPQILYALDQWELLPQYQDSLMNLVVLLKDNPDIRIELRSHTDSRATEKYNNELSQKRAQTVVDFLINNGIDSERLVAKGLGKSAPRIMQNELVQGDLVIPAGTELNDNYIYALIKPEWQELVHQLNRRTEFSVISGINQIK